MTKDGEFIGQVRVRFGVRNEPDVSEYVWESALHGALPISTPEKSKLDAALAHFASVAFDFTRGPERFYEFLPVKMTGDKPPPTEGDFLWIGPDAQFKDDELRKVVSSAFDALITGNTALYEQVTTESELQKYFEELESQMKASPPADLAWPKFSSDFFLKLLSFRPVRKSKKRRDSSLTNL